MKNSRENFWETRHLSPAYPAPFSKILSRILKYFFPIAIYTQFCLWS